ncbi:helix-turn-helix domain-containing protein [uncultured Marinobacter sp.]|uniref:GlxA family transcriptional regulator n=1 Tax=uncultured Marinobacter sp. TaxID=187379 RepID=UPI0030D97FD2
MPPAINLEEIDKNSVVILAFDGSVEMSITMIRDMFCAAGMVVSKQNLEQESFDGIDVKVASQDGGEVRTFSGAVLSPDASIEDIDHSGLVIVSGIWADMAPFLAKYESTVAWLRRQYQQGATIACMHSGAFLLAEAGLLNEKAATVYWRMVDQFKSRYPQVVLQPEKKITATGRLYCSAGVASGVELATYLMEKIWGVAIAQKISQSFLMDIPRENPFFKLAFDDQKRHADKQVLAAQQWLESNFSSDFLLEEVADKVGLSLRSFMRRFKRETGDTPVHYLQRIRIETAKELLRSSSLSIDEISFRVGYEDVSFFCRIFKRNTKMTTSEFRKQQVVE